MHDIIMAMEHLNGEDCLPCVAILKDMDRHDLMVWGDPAPSSNRPFNVFSSDGHRITNAVSTHLPSAECCRTLIRQDLITRSEASPESYSDGETRRYFKISNAGRELASAKR
jgi:hypothetical protein